MDPTPWYREGVALVALAIAGVVSWFWRFSVKQNGRITDLEKQMAIMNVHLQSIEQNIERGVSAIERMETRHREDIVRAYEHIEKLHLLVIEHLASEKIRKEDTRWKP